MYITKYMCPWRNWKKNVTVILITNTNEVNLEILKLLVILQWSSRHSAVSMDILTERLNARNMKWFWSQILARKLRNHHEKWLPKRSCKRAAGENWFWQDNQWSWVSETNIREVLTCALFQKAQTFGDRHWKLLSYVAPKFFSQLLGGSFSRPTP